MEGLVNARRNLSDSPLDVAGPRHLPGVLRTKDNPPTGKGADIMNITDSPATSTTINEVKLVKLMFVLFVIGTCSVTHYHISLLST